MPDPIASLSPSFLRRVLATGVLVAIASLMIWVLIDAPPADPGWSVFLAVLGAFLFWMAIRLWRATGRTILLGEHGLYDSDGICLAAMDNIAAVDRGVFAFKPSGGFIVTLKRPPGRAWAPGLWWRLGRRLGVGGVTPAAQGKVMAEILEIRLATGGES